MLKNKKTVLLALFLLSVAAGVYYPISKIIRFEFPSAPPAVCRFRAALYDPYDPFRGRYVALLAETQTLITGEEKVFENRDHVYAVLEVDEEGLAKVVDLTDTRQPGKLVIRTSSFGYRKELNADGEKMYNYYVSFPFYRFYMNEKLAPEAERAVRDAARNGGRCVIVAKIYEDGNYAITDLEIDGLPIHKFLEKERLAGE